MIHAQRAFERSVVDLKNISTDTGVRICIENMPKWDGFLLRRPDLDLGDNGFTLDVGHANTLGNLYDFLITMGDSISHFHLHDNNGQIDDHFFVGGDNIDYTPFSGLLNKSKAIKIIENKCEEDVVKSLESLKRMV